MSEQQSIYADIHRRVVAGEFEPGQRLRADSLAPDYGCAASTIREILFRLSTVGLVDFLEQRGFRIPQVNETLLHDLTRFRILLECEGACLSIRNGGLDWESRLAAAHNKLRHIENRISTNAPPEALSLWTVAELDFHATLIDACGSPVLKRTHGIIYQQFRQQLMPQDRKFEHVAENAAQHETILDAVLNHDEVATRERITAHLARNLEFRVKSVETAT